MLKSGPGDGAASLWLSTKDASTPSTTVSSSEWASSPPPAPRVINGVAIVLHGAVTLVGPDLTVTSTHFGPLVQGQTGATYTLTVANAGNMPTRGVVTMTDTLPEGLTATTLSGVGWSCTLTLLSCTRSDVLAAGATYPPVTLRVNVASEAAATVTNLAIVNGNEINIGNDTASDPTLILVPGAFNIPTFVQVNSAVPQSSPSVVTVTYPLAQAAGDLNVVVVGWSDSTRQVQSVSDTNGNVYAVAVGPTVKAGSLTQAIYYAADIRPAPAGANAVTVTFDGAPAFPDIRIAEYSGIDPVNRSTPVAAQGIAKRATAVR